MSNVEQLIREALLRHEAEAPVPDPLGARPVTLRARRRQVLNAVGAGLVALVLALSSVSGLRALLRSAGETPTAPGPTVPSPSTRVGFIGVPPEGATPSTPERGELVLSYWTSPTRMWVYADGRLIWVRHGDFPYGANDRSTGYLEQRLTPDGAELMRSEVISTGLFSRDLDLYGIQGRSFGVIEVRNGDRLVRVAWGDHTNDPPIATAEQASALQRLDVRLADPASWLPASAWEDREIRAYVPSRYSVCYQGLARPLPASRILALLPAVAEDLLRAKERIRLKWGPSVDGLDWYQYCSEVTTEEARALAEAFDEPGGFEQNPEVFGLVYRLAPGRQRGAGDPNFEFEPIFPHGEWTCSPCG